MNIRNEGLIAVAISVLVLGTPLVLIAMTFPAATSNILLDFVLTIACVVLWSGLFVSRGYRNLVIGVLGLPPSISVFRDIVGDLASILVAIAFAGWLIIGLIRKVRLQKQITRYLVGVAMTWLGLFVVVSLLELDNNKLHAALAFTLAASLFLIWRNWADPTRTSSKLPDPSRWSRDKDGNWRA